MEDFIQIPDLGNEDLNNRDFPIDQCGPINTEYAPEEAAVLIACLEHLKKSKRLNTIVEIGVDRDPKNPNTQTKTFTKNKPAETLYFGFDLEPRYQVSGYAPNCYFLQNDSADIQNNIEFLNKNGAQTIDLLFIDGWHSVNQVYKEWEWTRYLSPDGLVVMHDTNYHPGPKEILSKLNSDKWLYKKFCMPPMHCWGVSVVWSAKSDLNYEIMFW